MSHAPQLHRHSPIPPLALALCGCLLSGCVYAPFDLGLDRIGRLREVTLVPGRGKAKIALVRIDGEIGAEPRDGGLLGPQPSVLSQIKDELEVARRDDRVAALLLRINSPGGGVTASDIIYEELRRWHDETKRPIVAYFMDVAASGGYYVAQAADSIIASPTSITGSIGVIAQFPNVYGLGRKLGVHVETIKSGPRKDMGSPFRPMADDERALMQSIVDALHARFVSIVQHGRRKRPGHRGMDPSAVERLADGRVFTANQALELGLVDQVGYLEDAIAVCKQLAGIKDATVVAYERTRLGSERATIYSRNAVHAPLGVRLEGGFGAHGAATRLELGARALEPAPRFLYIWAPAGR